MNDNYFSSGGQFFFFNTNDAVGTRRAFEAARKVGTPAMYRVPANHGPWDGHGIVGHRLRDRIMADLSVSVNAEDKRCLVHELAELDRALITSGRLVA